VHELVLLLEPLDLVLQLKDVDLLLLGLQPLERRLLVIVLVQANSVLLLVLRLRQDVLHLLRQLQDVPPQFFVLLDQPVPVDLTHLRLFEHGFVGLRGRFVARRGEEFEVAAVSVVKVLERALHDY
jgi:hypothetical protein